jgi:hypothetical protein
MKFVFQALLVCSLYSSALYAQTAATAAIVGEVLDPTGSAVAGASVEILDPSTSLSRKVTANETGNYTISGIAPGKYTISASARGFRTAIIQNFAVEVARGYRLNLTLTVGEVSERIEVSASAGAELQTLDAAVGVVIQGQSLLRMPAINRSAMTFFALQPMVVPSRGQIALGAGQHLSGQVAGARADQNTFTIDGLDVSDLTSGTNFYAGAATDFGGPNPMIPAPAEGVEEFRLSTTNTNASYKQGRGGQLNLITRRGANTWHGSAYEYFQNNVLNANRWDFNRTGIRRPALRDNRFGGSVGGPIRSNKTFFFAHYDCRRRWR